MVICVLLLAIPSSISAVTPLSEAPLTTMSAYDSKDDSKIRILFIGNSYTYFNNLPAMIAALAVSAGQSKSLESQMVVIGAATLELHWQDGKALEVLKQGGWDYVVLQEQSTLGHSFGTGNIPHIKDPAVFHKYARLFDTEIKAIGAKTAFYLTWARKNAPETQKQLTEAYLDIAQELNAIVAPVGIAWESALSQRPELALHQDDMAHPNPAGSYLAACVFYAAFYGESPEGLSATIMGSALDDDGTIIKSEGDGTSATVKLVNLSESDALFLQQIAWQTVEQQMKVDS
jgi:hypothetical protein